MGERYVQALPDRDAAGEVKKRMPGRRPRNPTLPELTKRTLRSMRGRNSVMAAERKAKRLSIYNHKVVLGRLL